MALPLELPISDFEVGFFEQNFLPLSEANHVFIIGSTSANNKVHTCLINTYGRLHFIEENKMVFLPDLLGDMLLQSGHSLEMACADVYVEASDDCLAILATVFVVLNEHFCPCRYFGALFVISPTLLVRLTTKTKELAPVAHCSVVDRMIGSKQHKYWVLYEAGECISIYNIDRDFNVNCSEDMHTAFHELGELPGAVTRSSSSCSGKLHWIALGFDTGHVILSVFSEECQTVLRKMIKFSGPISVLMFLQYTPSNTEKVVMDEDINHRDEKFLVISSTLGPVSVWKCFFENDVLSWNNDFFLSQSEQFDTITSACVIDDNIAVGTYSGKILFYSSNCDLASHEIMSMMKIHAPIVSVKVLDKNTIYVLSTAGLHTVTRSYSSNCK